MTAHKPLMVEWLEQHLSDMKGTVMIWRSWVRTLVMSNFGCVVLQSKSYQKYTLGVCHIFLIWRTGIFLTSEERRICWKMSWACCGVFFSIIGMLPNCRSCSDDWREIFIEQSVNNADKLTFEIFLQKAPHWALYHVWFQNMIELYFTKFSC